MIAYWVLNNVNQHPIAVYMQAKKINFVLVLITCVRKVCNQQAIQNMTDNTCDSQDIHCIHIIQITLLSSYQKGRLIIFQKCLYIWEWSHTWPSYVGIKVQRSICRWHHIVTSCYKSFVWWQVFTDQLPDLPPYIAFYSGQHVNRSVKNTKRYIGRTHPNMFLQWIIWSNTPTHSILFLRHDHNRTRPKWYQYSQTSYKLSLFHYHLKEVISPDVILMWNVHQFLGVTHSLINFRNKGLVYLASL